VPFVCSVVKFHFMPAELQTILEEGELELEGQFMHGSNYTFLVKLRHAKGEFKAVYKPSQGEQRLWDFPDNTLAQREVATYLISEALGWGFVPQTVLRDEAPYGPGSLQRFVPYDPNYHYFNFSDEDKALLRPVVLFDLLINNADRKGSHILFEEDSHAIWLIDHGVCLHQEDKLRTVIWDFAGEEIPSDLLDDLDRLHGELARDLGLPANLKPYLSPEEIAALNARAERILSERIFPLPPEDRRAFPYPPL